MARIIEGIRASHSPTIGYAKDTGKHNDPVWKPIFDGFDVIRAWVRNKKVDVLFTIHNDHITSFFFDHDSAYALGIDDLHVAADECGVPREVAPARGHLGLSQYIGASLMADEFDMSVFQGLRRLSRRDAGAVPGHPQGAADLLSDRWGQGVADEPAPSGRAPQQPDDQATKRLTGPRPCTSSTVLRARETAT